MLISPGYQTLLQETHRTRHWGVGGHKCIQHFMPLFVELGCTTLLDYGSGKETLRIALAAQFPNIWVYCYDPGVFGREYCKSADFVVCNDVLEHVEPELIDNVLAHICTLATKGAYLTAGLRPAKHVLPDGRNAHLIIEKSEWWYAKVKAQSWVIKQWTGGEQYKRACFWVVK